MPNYIFSEANENVMAQFMVLFNDPNNQMTSAILKDTLESNIPEAIPENVTLVAGSVSIQGNMF